MTLAEELAEKYIGPKPDPFSQNYMWSNQQLWSQVIPAINEAIERCAQAVGHCKDCKWWTDEFKDRRPNGICLYISDSIHLDHLAKTTSAVFTAPDFGCIQFEKREA